MKIKLTQYQKDVIERTVRTFLQAFIGAALTIVSTTGKTPAEVKAGLMIAFTTAASTAFGIVLKPVGKDKDTSSVIAPASTPPAVTSIDHVIPGSFTDQGPADLVPDVVEDYGLDDVE